MLLLFLLTDGLIYAALQMVDSCSSNYGTIGHFLIAAASEPLPTTTEQEGCRQRHVSATRSWRAEPAVPVPPVDACLGHRPHRIRSYAPARSNPKLKTNIFKFLISFILFFFFRFGLAGGTSVAELQKNYMCSYHKQKKYLSTRLKPERLPKPKKSNQPNTWQTKRNLMDVAFTPSPFCGDAPSQVWVRPLARPHPPAPGPNSAPLRGKGLPAPQALPSHWGRGVGIPPGRPGGLTAPAPLGPCPHGQRSLPSWPPAAAGIC